MHLDRKAKDTDYLLITEDMKTYGCGCCSIGLGAYISTSIYLYLLILHVICPYICHFLSALWILCPIGWTQMTICGLMIIIGMTGMERNCL